MLIDWFTVGAQIVNFLVLVMLLKHFLYQPVLDAIASREQKIAKEVSDAAQAKDAANAEQAAFTAKSVAFDTERARLLAQAIGAANAEQSRLATIANSAAKALEVRRAATLVAQQSELVAHLTRLMQDEIDTVTRKALADLASVSLETAMLAPFLRQLGALQEPQHSVMNSAIGGAETARIGTSHALTDAEHDAVQAGVNRIFGRDVALRFEVSPALLCGIELSANGQRLAWSAIDYLDAVNEKVAGVLRDQGAAAHPEHQAEPVAA